MKDINESKKLNGNINILTVSLHIVSFPSLTHAFKITQKNNNEKIIR